MHRTDSLSAVRKVALFTTFLGGLLPSLSAGGQNLLYWTQSQRNVSPNVAAVDRAPTGGGGREDILEQLVPPTSVFNGIALDAFNLHVFVTDASGIHRTNLDGSSKITISSVPSTDLEIDAANGRLFYVPISGTTANIRAMNLDGTGDTFIMNAPGVVQGLALDVAAGNSMPAPIIPRPPFAKRPWMARDKSHSEILSPLSAHSMWRSTRPAGNFSGRTTTLAMGSFPLVWMEQEVSQPCCPARESEPSVCISIPLIESCMRFLDSMERSALYDPIQTARILRCSRQTCRSAVIWRRST